MKIKNSTLMRKGALVLACGLFLGVTAFSQIADPADHSTAAVATLNEADLSGTYVVKLEAAETDLYMTPLMASNNTDVTAYATGDITDSYAFELVKSGDFYLIKSGTTVAVWGLTNNWFMEFVEIADTTGKNYKWQINVDDAATAIVTIQRSTEEKFIKYELNPKEPQEGVEQLMKFYTDAGGDAMITFALLKVNTGTAVNGLSTSSVNIYPNPTSDVLNITNVNGKIKISNSLGQIVYNGTVTNNSAVIPVSSWNKGLYVVQVNEQKYKVLVK